MMSTSKACSNVQGLPCETYIFTLDKMESVIFFNGMGNERETWEMHAGGHLTQRFTEGRSLLYLTCIPILEPMTPALLLLEVAGAHKALQGE